MLAEKMADFADGPVLVVGERFDHQRHAAGPVALVGDLLVRDAGLFAGSAANRAVDVLPRHVVRLRFSDNRAEARVGIRIAATVTRSDRQLLDDAGEDLAPLGVGGTFLVLDCVPLGMAGHTTTPIDRTGRGC